MGSEDENILINGRSFKKRPGLQTDQQNVEIAYQLIHNLIVENPEIEPALWCSAVWSILVNGYRNCGFTQEMFKKELLEVWDHYEKEFE